MQYIFKAGEIWHIYEKRENQWIYQRLQIVSEEMVNKDGEELPGPLGRLDSLQEMEQALQREKDYAMEQEKLKRQALQEQMRIKEHAESEKLALKQEFERAYAELTKMAEQMQEEGRMWRQRYLDLAYQISPKGR